ncbi:MAG: protein kinase [Anaeromyxobacter sp.]
MRPRIPGPGDLVGGRYRVRSQLGAGGTGTVFEAVQEGLERRVALKLLHAHVAAVPGAPERFRREGVIMARLRHPNAVEVYEWGDDAGTLFLAMELLEGLPLDDLVYRSGALPIARIAGLVAQVLDVLEAAHALGIIHRDLKPSNLMVCRDAAGDRVKLLDLGLATVVGDTALARLTQSGALTGTPAYMSPEQSRAEPVDARSDLYALGCVLYELVTGQPPFGDAPTMDVLAGHVYRPARPPSDVRADRGVPLALERVILRALAKRPVDRPQSAAEMRRELLAAMEEPAGATPVRAARVSPRTPPAPFTPAVAPGAPSAPVGVLALAPGGGEREDADEGVLTALGASGLDTRPIRRDAPPAAWSCVLVVAAAGGAFAVDAARAFASAPGAPPVLLCGPEDDFPLMTAAIQAGLFDYVPLPLDPADLLRKVTRAQRQAHP